MIKEFEKFVKSEFGLEIWLTPLETHKGFLMGTGGKAVFHSKKEGIKGLLEFIAKKKKVDKDLIIFDKKVGNAAALLCVYLKVKEVYGVIGSQSAGKTLKKNKIKFYFSKTIPNILNKDETDICPMEKMSLSKTPKEFLNSLKIKGYF